MSTITNTQPIDPQRKETDMSTLPTTDLAVTPAIAQRWTLSRSLLAIGAAGPILFLLIATLLGLLDPSYDLRSRPVSELAVGPNGWLMTANFLIFGLSIIAFAVGLFRSLPRGSWIGSALLVISGAGMFAAGIFPTDLKGAPETDAGGIHNLLFLMIFLALIISYIFSALSFRKLTGWRAYRWTTALMPIIVFGLLFVLVGFGSDTGDPLYAVGGVLQRLLIAVAFGWMTTTAWRLLGRGYR